MPPVDQRKEMLLLDCKTHGPPMGVFTYVCESSVTCPLLLEPMGGGPIVQFVFSCCTHAHSRALIV